MSAATRPLPPACALLDVGPPIGVGPARRALDVGLASAALVLLAPVLGALGLVVRATSDGPAIFRQVRVGAGGRPFTLYKLRTMTSGGSGPEVTAVADGRVTPVGRFLRSTSLDELPQLVNILRGDMTLVGPRPETPALALRYPPSCRDVLRHRPGLTGPSQLRLRDADTIPGTVVDIEQHYLACVVPAKVAIDRAYLAHPSLRATGAVVLETVTDVGRHLAAPLRRTA